jgi:hypothetical protein
MKKNRKQGGPNESLNNMAETIWYIHSLWIM